MTLDKMQKRPYYIESYNPDWALQYSQIEKDIKQSFGDKPLSIEHTGSTSIPGMSAKPLIDVLVVVEKMEPFMQEKESMVITQPIEQEKLISLRRQKGLQLKRRVNKKAPTNILWRPHHTRTGLR